MKFSCKYTQALFENGQCCRKKVPVSIQKAALKRLYMLNASKSIQDLETPPGNCLKKLQGSRSDEWSIRINMQWRLCFIWDDTKSSPRDIKIEDYH